MTPLILSAAEARVLAALVEKSIATPQYYPMTVNAVMLAANQKSARYPLMALREGEVGAALARLGETLLVARDDAGSRVPKWRHRFGHELLLKPSALAVLATLMLRGPQTVAELRANADGLGGPAETGAVEAVLRDLADRAQPLVTVLTRQPGQSAQRYAHLLCGEPVQPASVEKPEAAGAATPSLHTRLERLEARVAELERRLAVPPSPET